MKYLLNFSFDGSKFQGYATQPHKDTIQDNIEDALQNIFKIKIKTTGSSRTDSGVHSLDHFISFESPFEIEPSRLLKVLNKKTDEAIYFKKCIENNKEINPRYSCKGKTYKYVISKVYNPFEINYSLYYDGELNLEKMQEASNFLIGEHDFKSFSCSRGGLKNTTRIVRSIKITENKKSIIFEIEGKSFLYNMVRIIVGTLIEVGRGKIEPKEVKKILESKDRKNAGPTIPPNGLYMKKMKY